MLKIKNNRPSVIFDSCYKSVLPTYIKRLKALDLDPATGSGKLQLQDNFTEKLYYSCPEANNLLQEESRDDVANSLPFEGKIISQTKLANGENEIVIRDSKTKLERIFKSKTFIVDPKDKNTLNCVMVVAYNIRKDPNTNQDMYYITENTAVIIRRTRKDNAR